MRPVGECGHAGHEHASHAAGMFHLHAPHGKMRIAFLLTLVILVVEVVGGILSHSLALWSDAGHVLTDLAAIGLSWYALTRSQKPADARMTYGYHRAGILAALTNGALLVLIAGVIVWQACARLEHPQPVAGGWMLAAAGVGLAINLVMALSLRGDHNLNVQSAVLHMLGDAAASAAVIVAGVVILVTHWYPVDPLLSAAISLLIAAGAVRMMRRASGILMEGAPTGVDTAAVARAVCATPGIVDVHDLHVWSIASGHNALSCHVVLDGTLTIAQSQVILRELEARLTRFGIGHVTVQTEDRGHPHVQALYCIEGGRKDVGGPR
ncbi:MAG: cation diffusion facilitator family transporter [Firmicutes bacterium]|nr:cation diffusion facilitator family transporter [Bacillota bacterium]